MIVQLTSGLEGRWGVITPPVSLGNGSRTIITVG